MVIVTFNFIIVNVLLFSTEIYSSEQNLQYIRKSKEQRKNISHESNVESYKIDEMIVDSDHRKLGGIKVTAGPFLGGLSVCNMLQSRDLVENVKKGSNIIMRVGDIRLSETFRGLSQATTKGTLSQSDKLVGKPISPLTLQPHYNRRENLYVQKKCKTDFCSIAIMGRGPGGYKGPGAVSILFDKDSSNIELTFKSNGASKAEVMFFDRNAEFIDVLQVDIAVTDEYRFGTDNGDIAGIAITPKGETLSWHKFKLVGICHD